MQIGIAVAYLIISNTFPSWWEEGRQYALDRQRG